MNIQQLPNTYYFWVLPEEDVRKELYDAVENVPKNSNFLVTFDTYCDIVIEFIYEFCDHIQPDYDCLDIINIKVNDKPINIMVTR